jgi:uncharacterized membrane protein YbhN (UPF0104 family)
MSRRWWTWARPVLAVAVLGLVVWRVGTGPFLDGVRSVDAGTLAWGGALTLLVTLCSAWRWRVVARALGIDLPFRTAVTSYYRSQFLNTALPGGVLGDVHRAVRHGRRVEDTGRAARAVAWERLAGQVVQVAVALAVLVVLPAPPGARVPALLVLAGAAAAVALVLALVRGRVPGGSTRRARALRIVQADLRAGLLAPGAWPQVAAASALAVAGHVATFLVAARAAGVTASAADLLPLALLVLVAMGLPTNIAGWGPREGAAAWAFGAAGLGTASGVATAVVYGVVVFAASLPGAAVLVAAWLRDAAAARAAREPT